MPSEKITELNEAEEPAKELLRRLGYIYVPAVDIARERNDEREVLLKGRLTAALMRINPWLSSQDAERAIFALENIDSVGMARNQRTHEYLTYGMPLDVDDESGRRTRTIRFFDFDRPAPESGQNEFIVTTQMRVRRGNERAGESDDDRRVVKPDLVLFVNGIPLVVMEAKAPTLFWKQEAIKQLHRYQEISPEWRGTGAPELFHYNLLCVAHCGRTGAVYAPIGAGEKTFAEWKSVLPYSADEVRQRFGFEAEGQARLIVGLLSPSMLLDVLRDFVVFEPESGRLVKKLPRYQQYRAVTRAVERIRTGKKPEDRGGVVWHTQGSGKSLTMLWLATKLRRLQELRNPTIIVVTDRTQLDTQITETFRRCGFPDPQQARSTRGLRDLLRSSAGHTVMTTIQKFEDALKLEDSELRDLNPTENVFVMVDEAHRTQYGLLGARMARALPNATFLGFTGTPIDKGFQRSTLRRFGGLIDKYTIPQSVQDGATVEIRYQARLPELSILGPNTLDSLFDALFSDEPDDVKEQIRRRYANKETVAEAERRLEVIALDIANHFKDKLRPEGFKAQAVASSRRAALRYADRLNSFGVKAYPIITTTNDDPDEFRVARELPQEQVIAAFKDPEGEPEILVVVDMLLTGFDAPVEQTLYLDRGLRDHALLQAIARVNRPFSHAMDGVTAEKTYGLVVDYYGVSKELDQVLSSFEVEDRRDAWEQLPEEPGPVIEASAVRAESHFKGSDADDMWSCVQVFLGDGGKGEFKPDRYERFNVDYREFARLMEWFLPDPRAVAYADRLARLTKIRAYVRAQYLREDADISWTDVSAKVKELIDSRIDAEMRELMSPVSILDSDFESKIRDLPHDEARASVMEHAIHAQITERAAENPVFYEKLSEKLRRIIAEMRQQVIDSAEAVRKLLELKEEALSETKVAAEHGLSEVSLAVYELLELTTRMSSGGSDGTGIRERSESYKAGFDEKLKSVAVEVEKAMQRHQAIVDWQRREDVQREMRRDIKRILRPTQTLSEDQLEELARSMVEVARRRASR